MIKIFLAISRRGVLWAIALFAFGCATAPLEEAGGLRESSLERLCQEHHIDWQLDSVSQSVTLNRGGLTASLLLDSRLVVLGQDKVLLSAPVKKQHGALYVPYDFKSKVIDKLVGRTVLSLPLFSRVVIDAGHGGRDPGAVGYSGIKEKDITLDIARKIKKILERRGLEVIMVREDDSFYELGDRARIANAAKPDLFVSIHANASRYAGVRGFEVYCLRDLDRPEMDEVIRQKDCDALLDKLSMRRRDPVLNKIVLDMLYNYKTAESYRLAEFIADKTSQDLNLKNRGCKTAGFYVLKHTLVPAVLVEVGFLSNKSEEADLKSDSFREKIAESIAESLLNYAQR